MSCPSARPPRYGLPASNCSPGGCDGSCARPASDSAPAGSRGARGAPRAAAWPRRAPAGDLDVLPERQAHPPRPLDQPLVQGGDSPQGVGTADPEDLLPILCAPDVEHRQVQEIGQHGTPQSVLGRRNAEGGGDRHRPGQLVGVKAGDRPGGVADRGSSRGHRSDRCRRARPGARPGGWPGGRS